MLECVIKANAGTAQKINKVFVATLTCLFPTGEIRFVGTFGVHSALARFEDFM